MGFGAYISKERSKYNYSYDIGGGLFAAAVGYDTMAVSELRSTNQ